MATKNISIGQIYIAKDKPLQEWRVVRQNDDTVTLECVEKPTVSRFVSESDLADPHKYNQKS